jgi:hypothetical protein
VFKIRPELVEQFESSFVDKFAARVLDRLYTVHPEFVSPMSHEGALEWVRSAIRNAMSNGFEYESEVIVFVDFCVRLGLSFENLPGNEWAKKILDNPDLTNPEKLEEVRSKIEPEIQTGLPG